jgi:hypothetical protein
VALDDRAQQYGLSRGYLHAVKISGVPFGTVAPALTLSELVLQGEQDERPHAPSNRPTANMLEWLGLAVGEMPYLISSARTVDDINWRSTAPNAAAMQVALIDALGKQLASSASLMHQALLAHHRAHPALGGDSQAIEDVDLLSHTLVEDHPPQWRRSEVLQGGYVTALAAAVQASGRLCEAQIGAPDGPDVDAAAGVVADALARALATLLGHARLNARDREVVESRAGRPSG